MIACRALAAMVLCIPAAAATAAPDVATAEAVIQRCEAIYHESGHPCACASDRARNGSLCGLRSAHDRAGGASPVCLVTEITPDLVKDFRSNEQAVLRERCHYHGR